MRIVVLIWSVPEFRLQFSFWARRIVHARILVANPQNVGAASQVHMGVWPPQLPPGDRLDGDETRPAGRRISPKQPSRHGSAVQHLRNLVPVSHTYLVVIRFCNCVSSVGWRLRIKDCIAICCRVCSLCFRSFRLRGRCLLQ